MQKEAWGRSSLAAGMVAVGKTGFRRSDPQRRRTDYFFGPMKPPLAGASWAPKPCSLLCKAFYVASWAWAKKGAAAACKMTPAILAN